MKQVRLLSALSVSLVLFASCQREAAPVVTEQPAAIPHTITIHASHGDTKTVFSGTPGNYSTMWNAGDYIWVSEIFKGVDNWNNPYNFLTPVKSDPLTSAVETATFSATFNKSVPNKEEDFSAESAEYHLMYFASSTQISSMNADEFGNPVIALNIPSDQKILPGPTPTTPNSIPIESDLLISPVLEMPSRPSELTFAFARVGTIVKMNLSGLPSGGVISQGNWHTGDNFIATTGGVEMSNYYWPETGKYKVVSGNSYVNFYTDSNSPVIADADGNVSILLRTFAGAINDWFELFVVVGEGNDKVTYSKYVDIAGLGASLKFQESGVTEFAVALKPAQAEDLPEPVYTTNESANHDGFVAVWQQGAHVDHYECYYIEGIGGGSVLPAPGMPVVEAPEPTHYPLTVEVIDSESGMVGVRVDSGLAPGDYTLYIKAIPDADSGPKYGGIVSVEMLIGSPVSVRFAGHAQLYSNIIDDTNMYYVEDYSGSVYAIAKNVNFGSDFADPIGPVSASDWYFQTSYSQFGNPEMTQFTFRQYTNNNNVNGEVTVYGINADTTETLLTGTAAESTELKLDNYRYYTYNLAGYSGVKVCGKSNASINNAIISYYK